MGCFISSKPADTVGLVVSSNAPLYLVSVPRSGATLLGAMLNSHKNIAMFNEPWFFHMMPKYGTLQRRRNIEMVVDDLCAAAKRFGVLMNPEFKGCVLDETSRLDLPKPLDVFAVFLELYAKHLGKHRWGVKQPWGTFDVPSLMDHFSDLKVIHIVRDPRATVAYRMGKEFDGKENLVCSLQYSKSGSQILLFLNRVHKLDRTNYFELRYEDLVRNPEEWLKHICDFLNEDYDPGMLKYHTAVNPYVPRGKDGHPVATHLGVLTPVHTQDVDSWDCLLSWREKAIVERTCYSVMIRYGYQPASSRREIETLLFHVTALRLQLRLAKNFFRRRIVEGIFHTCRKVAVMLFCRD